MKLVRNPSKLECKYSVVMSKLKSTMVRNPSKLECKSLNIPSLVVSDNS